MDKIEIVTLHDRDRDEYFVEIRGLSVTTKRIGPIKTREMADVVAREQERETRATFERLKQQIKMRLT